jgi:hypothetical protein
MRKGARKRNRSDPKRISEKKKKRERERNGIREWHAGANHVEKGL